jgi:hypothetical protein
MVLVAKIEGLVENFKGSKHSLLALDEGGPLLGN